MIEQNENIIPPSVLAAHDIGFAYHADMPVLSGVSLSVSSGEFVCILGANGSGKTTLLKCMMGRLKPNIGAVRLDGEEVRKFSPRDLARRIAYVPQQPRIAFAMSAAEIVLTGRLAHCGALGLAGSQDLDIAQAAMKMTQTLEFRTRPLDELSGGEAQRVMIARAIAQQPAICLLDEPTSQLDIANQILIYRMMQRLAHDWKMAIICVSHDVNLAARFSDKLILMRKGVTVAAGPPKKVVTQEVMKETYGVDVELIPVDNESPIVRAK